MIGRRQRLPKAARLLRRRDFASAGKGARRQVLPHFVVLIAPGRGRGRIGITASRKTGGAVARNRVKRIVREVFRRHRSGFGTDRDLVVIARLGASELSYQAAEEELGRVLKAAYLGC